MEDLVTMTIHVPDGVPDRPVAEVRSRPAAS
jgi:muconolactone delta-isomerase